MLNLKDIKCWDGVTEFKDYYTYRIDNRAKKSFNKLLGTDFKAVYRRDRNLSSQLKYSNIYFDTGGMYILKSDGTLLLVSNSEWAGISIVNFN
jgi:hypothetical protein